MFKHLYSSFKPWNDKVFFYLCMETKNLWEDLFGFSYDDNDLTLSNYSVYICICN